LQAAFSPQDWASTGSQCAVQTLAWGMLWPLLFFAATHEPAPPEQSLELEQNGEHTPVRLSHQAPRGHVESSTHASYALIAAGSSGLHPVIPWLSSTMVQRFPEPQSSASCRSRQFIEPLLLLAEVVVAVVVVVLLLLVVVVAAPWPPAPPEAGL
jgi:hypothetical protein